ncbi:MAG: CDP-diacylglycerol--glycerol-3-phosphate 3-phosphatidyltransferase [Nitrospirae bacterium CG18_big_fil_WC_8_21_14_2_50_70_55]|nr:CDP-diacylglycerol--glycerol-3-phosphate 3-phosphatidyltransferase [Deltaproteobacteria bacterium]PIQ04859.1 MAG: CDP-diacylglycerol--glycerol-3-phosphate 3-phosphatidyltransferase [Nitrospirae bacterium CG18_big_fil_WC_8_21_14_2_50_70_55]PIU78122.1 MAG: CDP-diacylglycerol--glycerol-3-phosphate 3-phosphatidyltransferase [Nitrospirae bacterium CG06_land_8_20_14_3_00_70_43]PIW81909.1 MAG: CDP-diacylglycerol--glycerol-3-phosphate 3-phosphatidyltransferase [Nitrospirae bacterium CG_4_8_14_3_um_fi
MSGETTGRAAGVGPDSPLPAPWLKHLPNSLTLLRVLLVPLFVLFHYPIVVDDHTYWAAGWTFTFAAITDFFDGYLARRYHLVTRLGKLLDPIADKVLITAALVMLVEIERAEAWIVVVILGREFAVTGLRALAASEGVVLAAESLGKWKVGAQITAILMLLAHRIWFLPFLPFRPMGTFFLWVAMVLAVVSAVQYGLNYWRSGPPAAR